MTDANPLQFCDRLRETLVRYLTTTIGVSEDHPDLARRIRDELETGAALVKGPFLETLPDFEKGRSIKDLCQSGVFHRDWSALGSLNQKAPRVVDAAHEPREQTSRHTGRTQIR